MKTIRLFDQNSHLYTFEAAVLEILPGKSADTADVILDATAFFPEEGGQYADPGTLGGCPVIDVQEKGGVITHTLRLPAGAPLPFAVGDRVRGEIDGAVRFARMQNHTGEHIISGIVHRLYGYKNVGFHLGDRRESPDVTLDFDGVLTRDQLDAIEDEANAIVAACLPVKAYYPAPDELSAMSYRAKLDLSEGVRIVHIEEYDDCACCAPHVARTGEVGIIRMPDFMHYKGGIRIRLLCGKRALLDYRKKCEDIASISQRLSVPCDGAAAAVARLAESEIAAKAEGASLARALADAKAESIPLGSDDNFCFFENLLGDASMRRLALAGAERTSGLVAVFRGSDREGYRFCMAGPAPTMRGVSVEMIEQLLARCGGSNELISGKVPATKKEILSFFGAEE